MIRVHGAVALRQLAKQRQISMNKLIEELSTIALTQFDVETRFRARVARGSAEAGLRLLDKLDEMTDERKKTR